LGGTRNQKPDAYRDASPAQYITADDPPMFFFHGEDDDIVPIRSPQRMADLLKEAGVGVEFHPIAKAGHMGAIVDRDAMLAALAFVNRNLKDAPKSTAKAVAGKDATPSESDAVHGE
jgi:dipeptidyl aminopeptidase/acylaminoacyl peptidase